jgi:hypothetical protein
MKRLGVLLVAVLLLSAQKPPQTEFQQRTIAFSKAFNLWCVFRNQLESGQAVDYKHNKEIALWNEVVKSFNLVETSSGRPGA